MRLQKQKQPYVLGHRGASGYAPENTMESFKMALEMNCDGVELDVQMSKDGELVIIHDETIDRTSDGTGWVKDLTFQQLREFNYNKTHPEYQHCDIPKLDEVLSLFKGTNKIINIEFKTAIIKYPGIVCKVMDLVDEYDMNNQVIYSSFNHQHCVDVLDRQPDAYVGFLYEDGFLEVIDYVKRHNGTALHPALYLVEGAEWVKEAKEKGLEINTWTVNLPEHMEIACQLGLTSIITNYPDVAMKIVEKYK